ncbi:YdeI/OmpD-associated family protein [Photobacterium sp. CCB-ST2H9]|uniref:YdeI/OmpD-associated family protein n=1 Tax=Photobacterium sp. CCB-ST2H9 TaxID=2912855 RepID=UPI00200429A4|nr:YdeI/OmpD-associated family protein [Photobacterium sp. CCB-ST2H9]UTM58599.1 YdeI/OmpD-associated family protein [Photobacterium sp. CCB-ST2H9]
MNKHHKGQTHPKVDGYIQNTSQWQDEILLVRKIALDCELTETLKWGKPCYTCQGNNIVILQGFKASFCVLFLKGALLDDSAEILEAPGENTQLARRARFTGLDEVKRHTDTLSRYISQAIAIEKSGVQFDFKTTEAFEVPEEFQTKLEEMPELKQAFEALTPGRQRAYLLHFSGAKQSRTRSSRVEQCIPQILDGKGLNDR